MFLTALALLSPWGTGLSMSWSMIIVLVVLLIAMVIGLRKGHARKNPWESGFVVGAASVWLLFTLLIVLMERA